MTTLKSLNNKIRKHCTDADDDISLAHVLRAIGKTTHPNENSNYCIADMKVAEKGNTLDIKVWGKTTEMVDTTFMNWDLTKPLSCQSEETLKFLDEIIT